MALVRSRAGRGAGKGGAGEDAAGEQGGSAAQSAAKVFYPFFPFSYVKSARKLSSLFAMVSSVSWGRGQGTPGLAPQLATEGGLILVRNVGFSLNTRQ